MHLKSQFVLSHQISGDYLSAVENAARLSTACLEFDGERLDGRLPDGAPQNTRNDYGFEAGL